MSKRIDGRLRAEIVKRMDIADEIGRHLELKPKGSEFVALSPLTNEKTPSFFVVPQKDMWHDFSSGRSGDVIGFHVDVLGVPFREAIEDLGKRAGIDLEPWFKEADDPQSQRRKELQQAVAEAATYYARALRGHASRERVHSYLKEDRGLTGALARDYEMGFAPASHKLGIDASVEALIDAGVLVRSRQKTNEVYPRFRDRVMFPIRDANGHHVSLAGRALGGQGAKYLNGPASDIFHKSRHLYGLYEAKERWRQAGHRGKLDHLLIGEGYFDAISPARVGVNATAMMSAVATTEQLQLAIRHSEHTYLCVDGDDAGLRGEKTSLGRLLPLLEDGVKVSFLRMPRGSDLDEVARGDPDGSVLRSLMRGALSVSSALREHVIGDAEVFSQQSLEERARQVRSHVDMFAAMPDNVICGMLEQDIASAAGMPTDSLHALVVSARAKAQQRAAAAPVSETEDAHQDGSPSPVGYGKERSELRPGVQRTSRISLRSSPDPEEEDSGHAQTLDAQRLDEMHEQLRSSPCLRAAQIALHHRFQIPAWDAALVAQQADLHELDGGALLKAITGLRSDYPEASSGWIAASLSDHEESHWLETLGQKPPRLTADMAVAAYGELSKRAVELVESLELDRLLARASERDLTSEEEARFLELASPQSTSLEIEVAEKPPPDIEVNDDDHGVSGSGDTTTRVGASAHAARKVEASPGTSTPGLNL